MKYVGSILALAAFSIMFMACSAPSGALMTEKKDDFNGTTWQIMRDQRLDTGGNSYFGISIVKEIKKGAAIIELRINNSGSVRNTSLRSNAALELFHIVKGEIILLIDVAKIDFRCTGND